VIENKKILAIIPARGGSKKLPRKNIRNICGKPLIAWTIEEAQKSKYIDITIVSTEDDKIIEISKELGAEIPFRRPERLASDKAKMTDVIKHTLNFFEDRYEIFILLQPSSPLRKAEDIDGAFRLLIEKKGKSIVSVCKTNHCPSLTNTLPEDLSMGNFLRNGINNKNRQELDKYYRLNGAIYLAYKDYFEQKNGFYGPKTYAYIMKRERSVDIDDIVDFKLAEYFLNRKL
jgi:N-acylneuraminate cytidylyltransferase/CMP-N,N'-diacetyllegionaminic acid synthase